VFFVAHTGVQHGLGRIGRNCILHFIQDDIW